MFKQFLNLLFIVPCLVQTGLAQDLTPSALKAMGAPNNPQVEVAWNRYYDYDGIVDIAKRLEKTFPQVVRVSIIGKTVQGRNMIALTVSNFKVGDMDRKPAMYIDGNIHSNEVQGSEVALYTAWYLAESFGRIDWITELLNHKTFYIVPSINPDARDYYIHEANTPHSPRSGLLPRDDDGDGLLDEDPPDDLNGDSFIVRMRKANPHGRWTTHPDDPRLMVRADADEPGEYDLLDWEGYDNDGDGEINEDGPGYYDPNRNWGWNWQPTYVQGGSDRYPFSIPENRAVADFVLAHDNIAGAQSYHNSGGMILRGPGVAADSSYSPQDVQVYDNLGKVGEDMLPGYDYLVLYKDLYSVYGGELDWFYGARGIFTFSNELWTSFNYFRKPDGGQGWFGRQEDTYRFDELLLFGEGIVDWQTVEHPQYGSVEIGGVKKSWTRTPPSFMIEDMCHRNMAFTLFHAYHLPHVVIDTVEVKALSNNLYQIDAVVVNTRLIPTRSNHEVKHQFTRPDWLKIDGPQVVAGFIVHDVYLNDLTEQQFVPQRLNIATVPAMEEVRVRWLVRGKPSGSITFDSLKGGIVQRSF